MIKNRVLSTLLSRSKYWLALVLLLTAFLIAIVPQRALAAGEEYLWQTSTSGGETVPQIIGSNGEFGNVGNNGVMTFTKGSNNQYLGIGTMSGCGTAGQPRYTITVTGANAGTISTELRGCAAPTLSGNIAIGGGAPDGGFTPNPGGGNNNGDNAPAAEDDWCDQNAGDFGWLMCWVVDTTASAVALLDCQIIDLLKIDTVAIFNAQGTPVTAPPNCPDDRRLFDEGDPNAQSAASSNAYRAAWSAFRNIALAILVILGLIMVASQIMGLDIFDAYTIRKMLPKLIIATILLTLSWNIMQFLFTASNAAADAVMAVVEYPFRNINAANGANFTNATLAWIIPTLLLGAGAAGAITAVGLLGFGGVLALLASLLLGAFSAWVLLVARDVIATALIIGSPLAIICSAYEPFEKLYTFWRGAVVTILISVPILAAILAISHAAALISLVGN